METLGRNLLKKIKEAELSGENAHKIYAPPYRPVFSYEEILVKKPMFAAVNILLYLKDNQWYFPLILRTHNQKDKHSGQISLPGGKQEETDKDFSQTAIRETFEEIGVAPVFIKIIRELSPIYIPPSNFYVYPFISFTKKNPLFHLQKTEAIELIEFPLSALMNLADLPSTAVLPNSQGVEVPIININQHKIWGATSMILNEFSHLLKNL